MGDFITRQPNELLGRFSTVVDCITNFNMTEEEYIELDRYIADELTFCDNNNKFPQNKVFIVDDVYEEIEQLSTVTPKSKTGHWIRWYETIEHDNCTEHDPHCKCSECDQEYDPYNASLFNYCPNCGAKMEKED